MLQLHGMILLLQHSSRFRLSLWLLHDYYYYYYFESAVAYGKGGVVIKETGDASQSQSIIHNVNTHTTHPPSINISRFAITFVFPVRHAWGTTTTYQRMYDVVTFRGALSFNEWV